MRSYIYGMIISFQFFTVIPIQKEVPMTSQNIERAIRTFPIFGGLLGLIISGIAFTAMEWTPLSPLAIAFLLWVLPIVLTGGIHLDGWIDTNDAFFSYRDPSKRLEIMTDPRTGAFGIISIIVLLAAKFLFVYETVLHAEWFTLIVISMIPLISRMMMGMMLVVMPAAKQEGLGYTMRNACQPQTLLYHFIYMILLIIGLWVWNGKVAFMVFIMFVSMLFIFLYVRIKVPKWFGGITGDVVGASGQGLEVMLWMITWLLHYYVMG